MRMPHDIEAQIYYLTAEEGGRSGAVYNGYRGQFYYDGNSWDAHQEFPGVAQAFPGQESRTFLALASPEQHLGQIVVGMDFSIREGDRTVATGKVTKIIELEESVHRENKLAT